MSIRTVESVGEKQLIMQIRYRTCLQRPWEPYFDLSVDIPNAYIDCRSERCFVATTGRTLIHRLLYYGICHRLLTAYDRLPPCFNAAMLQLPLVPSFHGNNQGQYYTNHTNRCHDRISKSHKTSTRVPRWYSDP